MTPLKFTPESSTTSAVKITECSVKIARAHIADQTLMESCDELDSQSTLGTPDLSGSNYQSPLLRKRSAGSSKVSEGDAQESQDSFSQGSQSDLSQRSKVRKKKSVAIIPDHAPTAERQTKRKSFVKMITNVSVFLLKCDNVRVVKSRKSKVKRSPDVWCESQDTQEVDSQPEQQETQKDVDVATTDVGISSNADVKSAKGVASEEKLFDSISTHDSFFELGETVSSSHDVMLDSSCPQSNSLEFSSAELPATSSAGDSEDTTPIPPRLVSEPGNTPAQTEDAGSSEGTVSSQTSSKMVTDEDEKENCVSDKIDSSLSSSNTIKAVDAPADTEDAAAVTDSKTLKEQHSDKVSHGVSSQVIEDVVESNSQVIESSTDSENLESRSVCKVEPLPLTENSNQTVKLEVTDSNTPDIGCATLSDDTSEQSSAASAAPVTADASPACDLLDGGISMSQFDEEMEVPTQMSATDGDTVLKDSNCSSLDKDSVSLAAEKESKNASIANDCGDALVAQDSVSIDANTDLNRNSKKADVLSTSAVKELSNTFNAQDINSETAENASSNASTVKDSSNASADEDLSSSTVDSGSTSANRASSNAATNPISSEAPAAQEEATDKNVRNPSVNNVDNEPKSFIEGITPFSDTSSKDNVQKDESREAAVSADKSAYTSADIVCTPARDLHTPNSKLLKTKSAGSPSSSRAEVKYLFVI